MRCSWSKIWCRNTGRQSLLFKGERLPNILMGQYPIRKSNECFNFVEWFSILCLKLAHFKVKYFFSSKQRILLISSPLQNTLKELWTMIHFLLPGITKPYSDFPVKAGTDQNQDYCHKLVIRLHRVRTKPDDFTAFYTCSTWTCNSYATAIVTLNCRWFNLSSWGAPKGMWKNSCPKSMNTSWNAAFQPDRRAFMKISLLNRGEMFAL